MPATNSISERSFSALEDLTEWVMCKGPIQWEYAICTKDQSYGNCYICYKDLMHVQMTNPMGQCM